VQELLYYVRKRGLNGVAITDHNVIKGAVKFQREVRDCLVIPGVEIDTKQGHILALFLKLPANFKSPSSTYTLEEAIETVHDIGGLAVAAHPTSLFRGELRRYVMKEFDAVEVMNASAIPFCFSTRINRKIAVEHRLPQTGGSDAHQAVEI